MAKPDYAFWAAQPEYTLRDAAFLCCDLEPENPSNRDYQESPRVAAMFSRIEREIPNRPPAEDAFLHGPAPGWSHLVSREALRAWAEDTGQRAVMPFLFPEDWEPEAPAKRTDPKTIEPGQVTEREEPSVLEILGAIIKAKYGPDFVPDLVSDRSTKIGIIQRDVERYIPSIDPKTLRKYMKRLPL